MSVCRNIKLNPSLHVEEKDYPLPGCPKETTPLNTTTVNHKTRKVLELEGPRRASSPAQGQTGFILQAQMTADTPRFLEENISPILSVPSPGLTPATRLSPPGSV